VLHAVSFLPITVLGAAFMLIDGLSFARMRALAESGIEDEPEGTTDETATTGAVGEADQSVRPVSEPEGVR
jgi:hypothetical protein